MVEVVDSHHVVHGYRYGGRLGNLHVGTKVAFRAKGAAITRIDKVAAGSKSVSFYARVVSSGKQGLVVRLADGTKFNLSSHQIKPRGRVQAKSARRHSAIAHIASTGHGSITVNILGLAPGLTVLVTETVDGSGNITISITLPSGSVPGVTGGIQASDNGASNDQVGTIAAVDSSGVTISTDQGPMTFTVDSADLTSNFQVGDVVDVSYNDNGDGTMSATDISYVEQDASGTVTSVSSGSITIDEGSGQTQTFSGDPSQGVFDGVSVGDHVDVTYHQSGSRNVADVVDDGSAPSGGGSGNGGGN